MHALWGPELSLSSEVCAMKTIKNKTTIASVNIMHTVSEVTKAPVVNFFVSKILILPAQIRRLSVFEYVPEPYQELWLT